jgi:uncharacterized membrane protein
VFYGVSALIALVIGAVVVFVLRHKSDETVKWLVGSVLFVLLIATAVSILANLPAV